MPGATLWQASLTAGQNARRGQPGRRADRQMIDEELAS
jgi:hypothetical protein